MSIDVMTVTDMTFDTEVLEQPGVVLVDFWAEWCAPCKALAPILADLATEYGGEARIAKINADDNPASSARFSVRGLPTMLIFVDGVERDRVVGVTSKTRLAATIDNYLEV